MSELNPEHATGNTSLVVMSVKRCTFRYIRVRRQLLIHTKCEQSAYRSPCLVSTKMPIHRSLFVLAVAFPVCTECQVRRYQGNAK